MKGHCAEVLHMMMLLLDYLERGSQVVLEARGMASGRCTYGRMPPVMMEGCRLRAVTDRELLNFNKSREN